MGVGQQQSISKTIDEVCTEVSRLIYDIISENQENIDVIENLRSTLKIRKIVSSNLNKFAKVLRRHIAEKLTDMFIEHLVEKYTTQEQRKAFIKEVCEIVLDPSPSIRIAEKLSQI
ncbi:MAG: hypothetical protein QWI36_00750 [Wolbachia endosymbiont of Tyrophagus putrescentiae]|nr:hypothetical protein [Wolbachia endosymbiont of Tyrophagus putrescentiae]